MDNKEFEEKYHGKIAGTVSWFDTEKGYGFIDIVGRESVFVYWSAILTDGFKTLDRGEKVLLDLVDGVRAKQAARVIRQKDIEWSK